MFVSIILDTEYYGMEGRDKWFLKNLSHAKENNCMIITHEQLRQCYKRCAENCAERFYKEFEMRKLSEKEYEEIKKGFVADRIFEELETRFVSRTEMLLYLFEKRYEPLEEEIIRLIDEELEKNGDDKVEAIFNCLDCFPSVLYLGEYYKCPVIPYCFSAIRKMHGYRQTLYMAGPEGSFRAPNKVVKEYETYLEAGEKLLSFSRRELLALFGKEKNLPLLRLLDSEPQYELGICKTPNGIYPWAFLRFQYTDADVYYEARKRFEASHIIVRDHPNIPWNGTEKGPRKEHQRNDPLSFILSCKRVATVESQLPLKALLWNRTVYMKGELAAFECMCEKDMESTAKADVNALNFYIFGYLIPAELMFDRGYWGWRLKDHPTPYEVYKKHLAFYLGEFDLDEETMRNMTEEERFRYILTGRKCSPLLIEELVRNKAPENVNYDVLYSKIVLQSTEGTAQEVVCINEVVQGEVSSVFRFEADNTYHGIDFYPFVDVGGFAEIRKLRVDGIETTFEGELQYFEKANGRKRLECEVTSEFHEVIVEWKYCFR